MKGDLMSSPASPLPAHPSLEQLRKQAKDLLRQARAGDPTAIARIVDRRERALNIEDVQLSDAQFAIAREHGFPSWARLKHHIEAIQRPADYDEPVWGRETWPFLVAALEGDEPTVRRMLARDPTLIRAEYAYLQALHYAVRGGRVGMVRLLLDAGADPLAEGWSGRFGPGDDTPLARARDRELHEIVALLERAANGRTTPTVSPERTAPLTPERALEDEMMRICHRGDLSAAMEMIRRHPGIAQAGLYEAVHQNHPELVRLLLEHGAAAITQWRWSCWYTPLMHTLRYAAPRFATAQLLLDHGVDPNDTNGMGMTTLHIVAAEGTTEAARWLVERGANLHTRDRQFDSTPLAWAARAGREDMVRLLISLGARPRDPDDEPWATPAAWARRRGHTHLLALLDPN
jgi:ankyrin repeat protein